IRSRRQQVGEWVQRAEQVGEGAAAVVEAGKRLQESLTSIEEELIQPRVSAPLDMINFPTRLNAKLAALSSVVSSADAVPTRQSHEVFQDLSSRIDHQLARLQEVIDTDLAAFMQAIQEAGIPPVVSQTL
ncbi:MAG: glycosyl hydrolase, partial [Nitrospinota bacterium]